MLLTGAPLGAVDAHRLGPGERAQRRLAGAVVVASAWPASSRPDPRSPSARPSTWCNAAPPCPLTDAIDLERETVAGLFATEDAAEGLAAFRAKRTPEFRGR